MSRVLVLRDAEAAAETAATLRALGQEPLLLPLQKIVSLDAPPPPDGPYAGIVVTSRNALPALAARLGSAAPPLLVVGAASAAQAQASGFRVGHVGGGSAEDLVAPAADLAKRTGLPLLLALGRVRTPVLEAGLTGAGIAYRLWETYDTQSLAPSREETARILGGVPPDAALLLSAGQAEGLAALMARMPELFRPLPRLICLSARISGALPKELQRFVSISPGGGVRTLFEALA